MIIVSPLVYFFLIMSLIFGLLACEDGRLDIFDLDEKATQLTFVSKVQAHSNKFLLNCMIALPEGLICTGAEDGDIKVFKKKIHLMYIFLIRCLLLMKTVNYIWYRKFQLFLVSTLWDTFESK